MLSAASAFDESATKESLIEIVVSNFHAALIYGAVL